MQIRRFVACLGGALCAALVAVPVASAQPGGGGFGFARGGGSNLLALLRVEEVQKEIEVIEDQKQAIEKLEQQLRSEAPQQRVDFRNLSEAEREKVAAETRARTEQQAKLAKEKLGEILLPHQIERLEEISLQQRGVAALNDEAIANQLNLTAQQKQRLETVVRENAESMRERMQGVFQSGDRDKMREQINELRAEVEAQVLAVLTREQRERFEKMKGEEFEMPQRDFGRGGPADGDRRPGGRAGEARGR
jgi:Spy/CpxP family protein refolding chaperone